MTHELKSQTNRQCRPTILLLRQQELAQPENTMAKTKAELLTNKERNVCHKIAKIEKGIIHKRAVALLTLGDGHTQPVAAEKSGLTLGQTRYALRVFKRNNLQLFPADTLEKADHADSSSIERPIKKREKKIKNAKETQEDSGGNTQLDDLRKQEPNEKMGKICKKCKKAKKTKQCRKCKKKQAQKTEKKRKKNNRKKSSHKDTLKKGKKGKKNKKSTKNKKS